MDLQVIVPYGPGHEDLYRRAMHSVKIAVGYSTGPFDGVRVLAIDDSKGEMGRSKARNEAVSAAKAEWLFFLDADDLMHPQCLDNFTQDHDAAWGQITELVDGNICVRYQVPEIISYENLIEYDPFLTIKMGHFVRREVALETPFNEDMDCGEDWDYYLRVWQRHRCIKINLPFFIKVKGTHSTGQRSATGRDWNEAVDKLLAKAREEWTRTQPTSQ